MRWWKTAFSPNAASAFSELLGDLASINENRNRYVHSTWVNQGDQKLRVKLKLKGKRGLQSEVEPADRFSVLQVAEEAKALSDKINYINEKHIGMGKWVEHPK